MIRPETLAEHSRTIEKLHDSILFDSKDDDAPGYPMFTPEAEQFFLLSVSALETAQRFMKLAHYARMQEK